MEKVFLSYKSTKLGFLCRNEQGFCFVANETAIKKLQQKNPMLMKTFSLNLSGAEVYSKLPYLFSQFIPSNERVDLLNKAEIVEQDDDFDKLYKLAGLNLMNINFKIHR